MAYPPPPGHGSLPPKPPPSAAPPTLPFKTSHGATKSTFTGFAPRAVAHASGADRISSPAQYSAPPIPSYSAQPSYATVYQHSNQAQPQYEPNHQPPTAVPQVKNPFAPTGPPPGVNKAYGDYDPEYEAQVQQWQSAYSGKEDKSAYGISKAAAPIVRTDASNQSSREAHKTVQRVGGGTSWFDDTLLEWDPAHFRVFVGNLAGEVTDDSLLKAFSKYKSVVKARVVRDKRTTKSKGKSHQATRSLLPVRNSSNSRPGYGFVSFSDGDDYFLAAKEMQGKYIGSHPVLIKRANTEVRPTTVRNDHNNKGKNKKKGAGGHNKVEHDGVAKKSSKDKGGLKILG